ncbi:MAG: phosphate ABC transporter permease subunit PstC [Clostridia bacterium]|nr:phosphate ABC transporter permease subunit PstC [Clostridia bacterium]
MKGIFLGCAVFAIIALLTICVFLFARGMPFIIKTGIFSFLTSADWNVSDPANASYGILSMIVASLYVTALSVAFGVVIGLFTAICLYKFCNKKAVAVIKQLINLLAGIPSVVYGLFGMIIIIPFLRDYISPTGMGYGILAASIVLSIMILPTIVCISLDSLNAVPKTYYEGALALGATKEQAVFRTMLPAAKSGIFAGVVLAIGRAIGETMAVIMVIGGSPEMPGSLFQSVRTMTANIAMGALEQTGETLDALIATGIVLFVFVMIINICFSLLKNKKEKRNGKRRI